MKRCCCAKCQREMYVKKTGVVVVEHANAVPGPYQLWQADLWACQDCGAEVVAGFADRPFAQHWQQDFKPLLEGLRMNRTCIDCFDKKADIGQ